MWSSVEVAGLGKCGACVPLLREFKGLEPQGFICSFYKSLWFTQDTQKQLRFDCHLVVISLREPSKAFLSPLD